MSLLDTNFNKIDEGIYKYLASIYHKIRSYRLGKFMDNAEYHCGGIDGDISNDMVLVCELFTRNGNYIFEYKWISKNHPKFDEYYKLYYTDEHIKDMMVTPALIHELIIKYESIL
jgi:hypothetical protein